MLLDRHIEQGPSPAADVQRISRRPGQSQTPLSSIQKRLWLLNQLDPQSYVDNRPANLRLTGPLNAAALRQSLQEIVRRHEALRSSFPLVGDIPVQQVDEEVALHLTEVDLRMISVEMREREAWNRLNEENRRPFDLAVVPLVRACLLRLADDEHWLGITFHRMVFDDWSEGVLWRDLQVLYMAFADGRSSPLNELSIGYGDFAVWQQGSHYGADVEDELSYWRQQLNGATARLELATDFPRPRVMTYRGEQHRLYFDGALVDALRELSRQEGATLFMVLLAAFQVLLSRYSGQADVCVGTPVVGRTRPELEELIGCFMNTLVLRTDLAGDPPFRELLRRTRDVALAAFAHQELPLEKLIEDLKPESSQSRSPFCGAMLVLRTTSQPPPELEGLGASRLDRETCTAQVDLTLTLLPDGAALVGGLEYSTDLFRPETIARMADSLPVLLEGIVADPDRQISRLPLLTEYQRRQVLVEWNQTETDYPCDQCIPELFEEQAGRTSHAVAVVCGDDSVTYAELNRRANHLAHHLIGLGVGPERLVGVCLERSVDLVTAMLATLKAGGAYLPLDPEYPSGRLAQMLADSTPAVVISTCSVREQLPRSVEVIVLDAPEMQQRLIGSASSDPVNDERACPLLPQHPAFVIYTSGSTGIPKAVVQTHATLVNLMTWQIATTSGGRVAQFTSISFDVSLQEVLLALLSGHSVVVVDRQTRLQPRELAAFINRMRITDLFVPNIVLQYLAEAVVEANYDLSALKNIYQGGEALTITPVIRRFFANHPGCRLHNHYGPSETHVITSGHLKSDPAAWPVRPDIGSPNWNARVYVLDGNLEPSPVGVTGEVYIAGVGQARGYLNRPGLTAERFVADPHAVRAGTRMYRTGDLARWRSDGTLEFLGRADHQVKIRGFRIEPGEIQAVLVAHPGVQQAAVIARDNGPSGKQLVAYVTPSAGGPLEPAALRRYLAARLPDYMVPSAFVLLDKLPMTPNGKLDRRALPTPERQGRAYRAPRTTQEQMLCNLFAEILSLERVGIDDNFFDLGGNSLLAIRLLGRLESEFSRKLPLRELFGGATIERLASQVEERNEHDGGTHCHMRSYRPDEGNRIKKHSCSEGHECARFFWIGNELPGDACGWDDSAVLLYLWPSLVSKPDIESLSEQYANKIRAIQPQGPYLLGGFCFSSLLAYEVARWIIASGQEVQLLVMLEPWKPGWNSRLLQIVQRLVLSLLHPSTVASFILRRLERSSRRRRSSSNVYEQLKFRELDAMWFKMTAKATERHIMKTYPGRLTLIIGHRMKERYFLRKAWNPLAQGGIEVYLVPGADWQGLYRSKTTAIQIKKCIDHAREGRSPLEKRANCECDKRSVIV
jgi:amino acid adenylation domain-containing protein